MEIEITEYKNNSIALIKAEGIILNEVQDALDIMANCNYKGSAKIIIKEENIAADFFDLKTRLAGDVLQKFSNYSTQLSIVGNFSKYESKSLRDFIYESNKGKLISFVNSVDEAKEKLTP